MKYFFLLTVVLFAQASFYGLQYRTINGENVNFSTYHGKKTLIVNIATGSNLIGQLTSLKTLQSRYIDKLNIVAFPSNSFNAEPRTNVQIKNFLDSAYQPNFAVGQACAVTGSTANAVYRWLTTQSENGDVSTRVLSDFQKYLIDTNGRIQGIFADRVDPMDSVLINAINQ